MKINSQKNASIHKYLDIHVYIQIDTKIFEQIYRKFTIQLFRYIDKLDSSR